MNKHEATVKIAVLKVINDEQERLHDLLKDPNFMGHVWADEYMETVNQLKEINDHMITVSKEYLRTN